MQLFFYVEREDENGELEELELDINATYNAGRSANLYGGPDHWSPSEPEEIDYTISCGDKDITLSDEEQERLYEKIRDVALAEYESAMEARAEERYNDRYEY